MRLELRARTKDNAPSLAACSVSCMLGSAQRDLDLHPALVLPSDGVISGRGSHDGCSLCQHVVTNREKRPFLYPGVNLAFYLAKISDISTLVNYIPDQVVKVIK